MKIFKALLITTILGFSSIGQVQAEPQSIKRPGWMTDAVIQSILAMNLTESQRGPFRQHLKECLAGIQADVHKVTKRGGFDLEKKFSGPINIAGETLEPKCGYCYQPSRSQPLTTTWSFKPKLYRSSYRYRTANEFDGTSCSDPSLYAQKL